MNHDHNKIIRCVILEKDFDTLLEKMNQVIVWYLMDSLFYANYISQILVETVNFICQLWVNETLSTHLVFFFNVKSFLFDPNLST